MRRSRLRSTSVLPGEDESLWREVEQDWLTEYNPQTATSKAFVTEAALAFWSKARCRRHLEQVEFSLSYKNAMDWTHEDHRRYSRFLRYKTAADRSFSRAFKDLEYLRKARLSEAEALRRAEERLEKLQLDLARDQAKLELGHAKQKLAEQKHADSERNKDLDRQLKAKQRGLIGPDDLSLLDQHHRELRRNTNDGQPSSPAQPRGQ